MLTTHFVYYLYDLLRKNPRVKLLASSSICSIEEVAVLKNKTDVLISAPVGAKVLQGALSGKRFGKFVSSP